MRSSCRRSFAASSSTRAQIGLPPSSLYAEHLTLVYRDEPLAQYRVAYQPDQRRLKTVTPEQLFETPYRSSQPAPPFPLDAVGT